MCPRALSERVDRSQRYFRGDAARLQPWVRGTSVSGPCDLSVLGLGAEDKVLTLYQQVLTLPGTGDVTLRGLNLLQNRRLTQVYRGEWKHLSGTPQKMGVKAPFLLHLPLALFAPQASRWRCTSFFHILSSSQTVFRVPPKRSTEWPCPLRSPREGP